jgi:uncharacterized protein (DUF1330 family)
MAAYILFIRSKLNDAGALQRYFGKVAIANQGHAVKPHVLYGEMEVLEGPPSDGVVVAEFPDRAAAKAWYHSPAYQEARAERNLAGDYQVILVEGFTPPT